MLDNIVPSLSNCSAQYATSDEFVVCAFVCVLKTDPTG